LKNRHFFNSPEQKSVNKTRNSDWIQKKLRIERFRFNTLNPLARKMQERKS